MDDARALSLLSRHRASLEGGGRRGGAREASKGGGNDQPIKLCADRTRGGTRTVYQGHQGGWRGGERSLDRGHFGCVGEKSFVRRDPRAGADLVAQIAVFVSSSKDAASPASCQRRSVAAGESVRELAPRLSALSILIRMVARGSAALIALREEVHDVARASLALQPCVECFGLFP